MKTIDDIGKFIFLENEPQESDVILIPGSLQWEHVEKAAEMYRKGYANTVMPCGGYSYVNGRFMWDKLIGTPYEGVYENEASFYKRVLMENGVKEEHIVCEKESTNTFENAIFAKRILEEKGIAHKRIMLCCQAYHARRAFMTFERYFQDSSFNVVPSVTMDITRENWYRDSKKFKIVMSELEKCGAFFNDMFSLIPGN